MPRRKKQAGELVDLETISDVSEARKVSLTNQGYRPYRTDSGKIKWLNDDQYLYKRIKEDEPKRTFKSYKPYRGHRKMRSPFKMMFRILLDNWVFVVVLLGILGVVIYINPIISFLDSIN
jgi:hypothetical protein